VVQNLPANRCSSFHAPSKLMAGCQLAKVYFGQLSGSSPVYFCTHVVLFCLVQQQVYAEPASKPLLFLPCAF